MKNIKRILSLTLVLSLVIFSNSFAGFVSDGAFVSDSSNNAFSTGSWIPGTSAYQFIKSSAFANVGHYDAVECVSLNYDGGYVEFYTANAKVFEFRCDQDAYDLDRAYSLDIYVNGIYNSSISDFDSENYSPYSYEVPVYPNGTVKLVYRSLALVPKAGYLPIYITHAVFR